MDPTRRSLVSALGLVIPFGLAARPRAATPTPVLRLRPFEDAVREAFADAGAEQWPCRRIEVGHSEVVEAGLQGCCNDRPFAGFPAGRLRIVRCGSAPGPSRGGVRLWVATVDVVLTGGRGDARPIDFTSLPAAPGWDEPGGGA